MKKTILLLAVWLCFFSSINPANLIWAASVTDLEKAKNAFDSRDYKVALELFKLLAEAGNAEAQFYLGFIYDIREGKYKEAVRWYRKAAEQGYSKAQNNLGEMYHIGAGVKKDYKEAVRWYRKSAEQGNAEAQYLLGGMYYLGQGVIKDYVLSHMWYNIARANGTEADRKARDVVEKSMSSSDISRAQALAQKCLESDYQDCGE